MSATRASGTALWGAILLALMAGPDPATAESLERKLDHGYGDVKHALGWDTASLRVVERDKAGNAVIERDSNASNDIERRTSYYENGNKKARSVVVVSKRGGKLLTEQKTTWGKAGQLESSYTQDNAFDKKGAQTQGLITERDYEGERLVHESGRAYSAEEKAWSIVHLEDISYFSDGDMKERIIEEPLTGNKERETWSESKGALGMGRKRSVQKWDLDKGSWE
jgi:hypothetical protein